MTFDRPLFFFDLETTGVDPAKDRIVQIAFRKIAAYSGEVVLSKSRLINPEMPIPEAASAIHGVTDSSVQSEPTFRQVARSLLVAMEGCDLAGYNILNFDVPLLFEEFFRAGIPWEVSAHRIIDSYALWQKMEPRKLANAVDEFTIMDPREEDFHDAEFDVLATQAVLQGQLDRWPDSLASVDDIVKLTRRTINVDGEELEMVDLAGVLARRADGAIVFTHKRVRGKTIAEDLGYAGWLLKNDFPMQTKLILQREMSPHANGEAERRYQRKEVA